jgi:hypothetical protein
LEAAGTYGDTFVVPFMSQSHPTALVSWKQGGKANATIQYMARASQSHLTDLVTWKSFIVTV